MIVEEKITINKNNSAVWTVITNIRHIEKIISGIEKIEILYEPENSLVGLKWRETRIYFDKPSAIDKWITDAVDNKFYKTRAEMNDFIFLTTMSISENGDNTILTSSHETKSQGIIAIIKSLPMIFFRGLLKKAILKDLNDIKNAVENK
jgi:hypothetical protein